MITRLRGYSLLVVGSWLSCLGLPLPATAGVSEAEKHRQAEELVREALHREIYAQAEDREHLLRQVLELVPDHELARSQVGEIRYNGQWVPADAVPESAGHRRQRLQYEAKRATMADTVQGHLALANWCQMNGLALRQQAHLNRVIQLVPDHAEARLRLGYQRTAEGWVRQTAIWQGVRDRLGVSESIGRWKPVLDEIQHGLNRRGRRQREAAAEQLRALRDVSVVPALEVLWAYANPRLADTAVQALSELPHHQASLALARIAVFSPWPAVREGAAKCLRPRPHDGYVPALLAELSSPIESRFLATVDNGQVLYRHAFFRERQNDNQLTVLDASVRARVSYNFVVGPGPGTDLPRRSQAMATQREIAEERWNEDLLPVTLQAIETAGEREALRNAQNAWIRQMNDRICTVLAVATGEQQPASPEEWWAWWNEENGVSIEGSKYTNVNYVQNVSTVEYDSEPMPVRHECFVAGTPVWTMAGRVAIESISVGDLVLCQNVNSGQLAYRPVLGTTQRPEEELIRIRTERLDTLECSGGHPFWVSGDGWIQARHLQPGMCLHGLRGGVRVLEVETGSRQETYNLIVAEHQTYFVGEDRLLCHDNTSRRATNATVPGLQEQ